MIDRDLMLKSSIFFIIVVVVLFFPLLEVTVSEEYSEAKEMELETEIDVSYPVTVEEEWNRTNVSSGTRENGHYLYWTFRIPQQRRVDYYFRADETVRTRILTQAEFPRYQSGDQYLSVAESNEIRSGTLSFESTSAGEYVFICSYNPETWNASDTGFTLRVGWMLSTRDEITTCYRTETEYKVSIETREVAKKVTLAQRLTGAY